MLRVALSTVSFLSLVSCTALPSSGPSRQQIADYKGANVIPVTAELSRKMHEDVVARREMTLNKIEKQLKAAGGKGDYILAAGDQLSITLSSWSSIGNQGNHSVKNVWQASVTALGDVSLPYLDAPLHLAGLTLPAAEARVVERYKAGRVFLAPSASIQLDDDAAVHGVLVAGAVGRPSIVPWVAGGMTMAQALTASGSNALVQTETGNDVQGTLSAASVTLVRKGQRTTLPLDVALGDDIPVLVGDKLLVSNNLAVEVTVMGGGISNGLVGFAEPPSLAQVIARSKGLSPTTADAKSVYVIRQRGNDPAIYSFSYKTADALLASQLFPVEDGDIVYVSEAAFVPIQQVMSAVWPITTIAQTLR